MPIFSAPLLVLVAQFISLGHTLEQPKWLRILQRQLYTHSHSTSWLRRWNSSFICRCNVFFDRSNRYNTNWMALTRMADICWSCVIAATAAISTAAYKNQFRNVDRLLWINNKTYRLTYAHHFVDFIVGRPLFWLTFGELNFGFFLASK